VTSGFSDSDLTLLAHDEQNGTIFERDLAADLLDARQSLSDRDVRISELERVYREADIVQREARLRGEKDHERDFQRAVDFLRDALDAARLYTPPLPGSLPLFAESSEPANEH
jgi:hypothetical protein